MVDSENYYASKTEDSSLPQLSTNEAFSKSFGSTTSWILTKQWNASTRDALTQAPTDVHFVNGRAHLLVKTNLTTIVESVRSRPITMCTKAGYGLLEDAMLRSALFSGLYNPYESFPTLTQGFPELGGGDGTRLFDTMNPKAFSCDCRNSDSDDDFFLLESGATVLCNDVDDVPGDLQSGEKYYKMFLPSTVLCRLILCTPNSISATILLTVHFQHPTRCVIQSVPHFLLRHRGLGLQAGPLDFHHPCPVPESRKFMMQFHN